MRLNFAGGHTPSVESDDLVVEAGETTLPLGQDNWFSDCVPVAGKGLIEGAKFVLYAFHVTAIAGICCFLVSGRVLLIAPLFTSCEIWQNRLKSFDLCREVLHLQNVF